MPRVTPSAPVCMSHHRDPVLTHRYRASVTHTEDLYAGPSPPAVVQGPDLVVRGRCTVTNSTSVYFLAEGVRPGNRGRLGEPEGTKVLTQTDIGQSST